MKHPQTAAQPSEAGQLLQSSATMLSPENPTTVVLGDLGQAFGTVLCRSHQFTQLQQAQQHQGPSLGQDL